jgi:thioester reductase-like protein
VLTDISGAVLYVDASFMTEPDVVLVTGYPRLHARAVCAEILASHPESRVRAVVAARDAEEARNRLADLAPDVAGRLELLDGDPSAIDMGLSGAELKELAGQVTRIHCCPGAAYAGVDRRTAEHGILDGAREALELASVCRHFDRLVFHSTAHVSGDRSGVVLEEELKSGQSFRNVVEEAMARAEKVMRAAMMQTPITVVRPGAIVGDSRTGEIDAYEGPSLLILLFVTSPPDLALPLPGRGEGRLSVAPVDWVARASVALGRAPAAVGRTFHLVDPSPPTVRRVFELLARAGGRREPRGSIPATFARALLRAPGLDRIAQSPRTLLETMTTSVVYDSRGADELLQALEVQPCPPFEGYVDRLVEYVQRELRERRGARKGAQDIEDPLT